MIFRWAIVLLLAAIMAPRPAPAQAPNGLDAAKAFLDRTVRVSGMRTLALPGDSGYGIIAGERRTAAGDTELIIVLPDHLVRDPARPNAVFSAPVVAFRADPGKGIFARLLDQHLPPADGDLAVVAVPKPANMQLRSMPTADLALLAPGAPVWTTAHGGDWSPQAAAGRLAVRGRTTWLNFDGLFGINEASGAAIVNQRGIIAMLVGQNPLDRALTQGLPIDAIAARMRAWDLPWDTAAGAAPAPTAANPSAGTAPVAPSTDPTISGLVTLLPSEVAARRSWTPMGARVSPWTDSPIRLFGAPRSAAPQIGTLPAGITLPGRVLMNGAYAVIDKLDSGAWFLLAVEGRPVGYVTANDIVEIWPLPEATGMAGGKVVREWTAAAGKVAALRDAGNAYELETAVTCAKDSCDMIIAYTPAPPNEGATLPTFQTPPLLGHWQRGDVITLRLQLPRRIVEVPGTKLMACTGREGNCIQETLLPPPPK